PWVGCGHGRRPQGVSGLPVGPGRRWPGPLLLLSPGRGAEQGPLGAGAAAVHDRAGRSVAQSIRRAAMGVKLKEKLARNELVRVFALGQLCGPKLVEMVGFLGGYDAVWLDQEHAGLTVAQVEEAARAARGVGLDSFVRLAPTDYATVMRPLEAGPGGVMAAQVRSPRQTE